MVSIPRSRAYYLVNYHKILEPGVNACNPDWLVERRMKSPPNYLDAGKILGNNVCLISFINLRVGLGDVSLY